MDSLRGFVASCEDLFSFAGIRVIRGCFCCGLNLGQAFGVFLFALSGIRNDGLEIKMEFFGNFLSCLADLLDGVRHYFHSQFGLRTAAASRPYLGSMAGGTPALRRFLCGSAALRENICGDLRHLRGNFTSSSFGEDVVEGAGGGGGRIGRGVGGPGEGEIHCKGIRVRGSQGISCVIQS